MPSLLGPRDTLTDFKDTLSSWDKCMAKTYCKWPVIVVIIVVSLTVLSVVMCVARCICCGAECACCCFRCCAGCCGSGRGKNHKRINSQSTPAYPQAYPPPYQGGGAAPFNTRSPNEQYQSHTAPTINSVNSYRAPGPERPQFATFETPSKPVNEDSLPAMPEWSSAKDAHVEEEVIPEKQGDMEMHRFDNNSSVASGTLAGTTAVAAVGPARRSPGNRASPLQRLRTEEGYEFPPAYQNGAAAGSPRRSPNNSPGPYSAQYGQQQDPYRDVSPIQSSPVNGMGGGYGQNQQYSRNQQYGRSSPAQGYNQYNRPPQGHSPAPQGSNGYGYGTANDSDHMNDTAAYGAQPNNNYASVPTRSHTPGYSPSSAYPGSDYTPTESTQYEPSVAYPGQQAYASSAPMYPPQQTYRAFSPAQQPQQSGVIPRRPVDGSWKEV